MATEAIIHRVVLAKCAVVPGLSSHIIATSVAADGRVPRITTIAVSAISISHLVHFGVEARREVGVGVKLLARRLAVELALRRWRAVLLLVLVIHVEVIVIHDCGVAAK